MKHLASLFELRPRDGWAALLLVLLAIGLPMMVNNDYYINLMVLLFLYAGMASAWNIVGGMAGQFSLGHTAFFGVGSYTSTLLYNYAGVSPWAGLVAGGLLSMFLAWLIAFPAFRMRGVFFAMATMAFGETLRILLTYSRKFIDIPYGLSIDYRPGFAAMIFEDRASYALLAGVFMLLVTLVAWALSRSWFGAYLRAIRDNEEAAVASGIPMRRYKLIALLISAFFTSAGGTILTQYVMYIEPTSVFNMAFSVDLPLMALLGGIGTVTGPLIGALIALPLREFLLESFGQFASGMHLVVYGVLLVVIVILMPNGVWGLWDSLKRRFSQRRSGGK